MDLRLGEEQRLLVESAESYLGQAASMAATRAAAERCSGFDPALWRGIAELGWCGVHLPEAHGGLGLGLVEVALLQEQLGRRLACVPFLDAVLASALLHDLIATGASARALPRLATGQDIATAAVGAIGAPLGAPAGSTLASVAATAARTDAGWRLDGRWPRVGSAAQADLLLLPAATADGETALFAVARGAPGLHVRALAAIDRTRSTGDVTAAAVPLDASACVARGAALSGALARHRHRAAIALGAEQLGIAQQCLDLAVAYTKQRVQFGRPLAAFQAVKHRCAGMMVTVESARSAVLGSAAVFDGAVGSEDSTRAFHAALALVEATEAAQSCAQEAIQLHGGAGFTWDFDPHLYFKRAQANSQRLGSASVWLERVASQLLAEAAA